MPNESLKPAMLSAQQLAKLKSLESEIGDDVVVIAYAKAEEPAKLEDAKLKKLQETEKELGGVYLIAWKRPKLPGE
jgi:hypothetical protein